jgi:glycosidase
MDPNASEATRRRNLEGWFIDILPDLNQDDEEVRRYLIQNALWWLGTVGFDAVRMDTLPHVPRHFWRDWSAAIKREHPHVNVLGELFDGDPALLAYFQRGRAGHDGIDPGIDTLYDFALFYAVRDAFAKGQPVRKLAQVLAHDWLYPNPRVLVPFLGVHDMERFMHEPGATTDGLKLAQTFIMTTRGTPLLYYGDELAMPGAGDPDNRRDFPGGFPGDRRNAFESRGRTPAENDVFNHLRRLARLRAELAPLRRGSLLHVHDEDQQTVFARTHEGATVLVAFNNDMEPALFRFSVRGTALAEGATLADRLENLRGTVRVEGGALTFSLPARSSAVLQRVTRKDINIYAK